MSDTINAFRDAMAAQGIHVSDEIIADGKLHRIYVDGDAKLSRNGWYTLHLDGMPAGAFGCNKRYGNEQRFKWTGKSASRLTPEERREYRAKMERKRVEREAAEKARRRDAAALAVSIWDAAAECAEHPYLTRKGVKSYGLRVGAWERVDAQTGEIFVVSKKALLIPVRDGKRQIHSLQAIFPDKKNGRDKDYLKDGAKAGLCYSFGKPIAVEVAGASRVVILIGEGYATLATAHEATGHACVVAFDAGNLLAVALGLRKVFPDASLVILADNDRFTLDPINNPGVHFARKAAEAVGGLVAIPHFAQDLPGKPTDFNDLAAIHGLDAVRDAIAETLNPPELPDDAPDIEHDGTDYSPESVPEPKAARPEVAAVPERNGWFRILGYNRRTYFIFSFGKSQIMEITKGDMSDVGLIELAPLTWWEVSFPGRSGGIDNKAAAEFIIRVAERRGIYDAGSVRGRGAWIDDGRMVYHHGKQLTVDRETVSVTKMESRFVYELEKSLPLPADTELTKEDGREILNLAKEFRWTKPCSAALLVGWVALAPICGAMPWRPHIWLTGGAGSGKSTILDKFVHHLLGGIDLYAQGNSTEAGMRQELKGDARPVLFDESESNEQRDSDRIQTILSLIRQASTDSEAHTYKGSANGTAMHFHIRSMFCLASIQVALKQQADMERLTVLALRAKHEQTDAAGSWDALRNRLYDLRKDKELPGRMFRRALNLLPVTLQNIVVFSNAAAERFNNQREGDQYGTLLAGAWSLISEDVASKEQALHLIDSYDWSEYRENTEGDEAQAALATLLGSRILVKAGTERTIHEIVCAAYGKPTAGVNVSQEEATRVLRSYGMIVRGDRLILSNESDELKKIMSGTKYAADYRGVLLRVAGAGRYDKTVKFSGLNARCFYLQIGAIVADDDEERHEPAF